MSKKKSVDTQFDMEDDVSVDISFGEAKTPTTQSDSNVVDTRLLVPKAGHKYKLRMLFFKDVNSSRTSPWISKYNHGFRTKNEHGDWITDFAICPTTPYLEIQDPWRKCKICEEASELWSLYDAAKKANHKQNADKYKKLYDKFKRRYALFIPVLVMENTENQDTIHSVMILTLNSISNFNTITALIEKSGNKKTQYFNNFTNTNCFDLCLDVKNTTNPNTGYSFREIAFTFEKATAILAKDWNEEKRESFFTKHIESLNFDKDFYVQIDYNKLDLLYDTYVVPEMSQGSDVSNEPTTTAKTVNAKTKARASAGTQLNKNASTDNTEDLAKEMDEIEALLNDNVTFDNDADMPPVAPTKAPNKDTQSVQSKVPSAPETIDDILSSTTSGASVSNAEIDDILSCIDGI